MANRYKSRHHRHSRHLAARHSHKTKTVRRTIICSHC
ncbi:hypothetical protein BMETH_2316_0 [methanotrophic bacterial endosymbiont of Bathymodiolus sp.]|nr:hypothetical protein BMETH_2316_0 [methanotrophic bacterial endosymbiont of Bathymodiolus sp.]